MGTFALSVYYSWGVKITSMQGFQYVTCKGSLYGNNGHPYNMLRVFMYIRTPLGVYEIEYRIIFFDRIYVGVGL